MALFFDHPQASARGMRSVSADVRGNRRLTRPHGPMPGDICVRLVGGWLVALAALLALVLTIRWYA